MTTKAKLLDTATPIVKPTDHTSSCPSNKLGSGEINSNHLNRMFRRRGLTEFIPLGRTQIDELIKAGDFPEPVPLSDSGRAVAWLECDLVAWQKDRIAARNARVAEREKAHTTPVSPSTTKPRP
ncbi:AlpA family transcriptional regulator [Bradyrhizobium sp. JYMT SZCCT0428]|uniref:helix-turn-helix transcriptional regulator n=1 Tax=Bradyrhizobium sp. JYMT SZCCT0428 TaxID=2807673 RepID=UPI001BA8E779|nr:AlpA family phage regulatory protein [Bradyrhizobium sp. JYMT SZCCT0428]MBR1156077.1 AlpA family phage regulatory protein [Bradyrhizobium sp. JYMT SZCCT0428]